MDLLRAFSINPLGIPPAMIASGIGVCLFFLVGIRVLSRVGGSHRFSRLVWFSDIVFFPLLLVSSELLIYRTTAYLQPAGVELLETGTDIVYWLLAAWLLARGLDYFLWPNVFSKPTRGQSPRLLKSLVKAAIYIVAIYCIFTFVFQYQMTGVLVSTGVLAVVLGLALQSVLSDFFAGLAIVAENTYSIGDWIELDNGISGKVVDIAWRTTRLQSLKNSIVIVPNNHAARSIIHNHDKTDSAYACWFSVSINTDVPIKTARRLLLEAVVSCRAVLKNPPPSVLVGDATGQPFQYKIYVHFKDYLSHWAGKSELFENIQTHLSRCGISTATKKYEVAATESSVVEFKEPTIWEHLRAVDIFGPLSDDEIEQLSRVCVTKRHDAGEIIISEGEAGGSLFVIWAGVVSVHKENGLRGPVELDRLGSGQCFGEMSLLTGSPRSATAKALTQVETIEVLKENLGPLLHIKPELSQKLAEKVAFRHNATEGSLAAQMGESNADHMSRYAQAVLSKIVTFFSLTNGSARTTS